MNSPAPTLFEKLKLFIAAGFGSGLLKPAPGTWGSFAALLFGMVVHHYIPSFYYPLIMSSLLFILLNQWTAPVVIKFWGKDPGKMVMDEWAGMLLSLGISIELFQVDNSLIPSLFFTLHFAIFRLFDIIKPLGINRLQNFSGGFGILLDDLAAGIYTSLAILLISQII